MGVAAPKHFANARQIYKIVLLRKKKYSEKKGNISFWHIHNIFSLENDFAFKKFSQFYLTLFPPLSPPPPWKGLKYSEFEQNI